MRVLVTGACGFVGSRVLRRLRESTEGWTLLGMDNLCRMGSERNRPVLKELGVGFFHGDVRCASDFDNLPPVDWVIDAAANPSVLAGVDGLSSSRQVIEHNLQGTVNMLEYCRRQGAGFVLLSTSRVYGVGPLSSLPVRETGSRFVLDEEHSLPVGVSARGVTEEFSTTPPLSLYGVSKKMSEDLALEYASTFDIPVHVNRCGVMAGAGQFGRADQGIVAFWIHSWRESRRLRYLGFGGKGLQVRDVVHPDDVAALVFNQIQQGEVEDRPRVLNVAGGPESTFSLAELSAWCEQRFGYRNEVQEDGSERPFDIAWLALDDSKARTLWGWQPEIRRDAIFSEVAKFAEANPDWMHLSS
ncbi:NAD-dependent epimerase/dehydratase family protein [Roseimicrobium sp. ORNL1]|uniref:NAD-dependent epimerase/dehydratase family protein n=1 Tax=Roseimicrobium sp. ORNL1 TaxID=2711231 RepID=UPI0013E1D5F7|nr:NAD-dependent epimerase/dehydratase family protein [Roseimicrobium sp. ORNL1]QIF04930.1 NAD-dependent epimerase/dehydratase family protein [Roseimicrobium sp. ORNL1]